MKILDSIGATAPLWLGFAFLSLIIHALHYEDMTIESQQQLPYFAVVFGIVGMLGICWWTIQKAKQKNL